MSSVRKYEAAGDVVSAYKDQKEIFRSLGFHCLNDGGRSDMLREQGWRQRQRLIRSRADPDTALTFNAEGDRIRLLICFPSTECIVRAFQPLRSSVMLLLSRGGDIMTADQALILWSTRWALMAGAVVCGDCQRRQTLGDNDQPYDHRLGCKQHQRCRDFTVGGSARYSLYKALLILWNEGDGWSCLLAKNSLKPNGLSVEKSR
jgi:hypothetical protein